MTLITTSSRFTLISHTHLKPDVRDHHASRTRHINLSAGALLPSSYPPCPTRRGHLSSSLLIS